MKRRLAAIGRLARENGGAEKRSAFRHHRPHPKSSGLRRRPVFDEGLSIAGTNRLNMIPGTRLHALGSENVRDE
ncbi:MAG: hypothetical protein ACREFU_11040 [Acetobacteraceae bacterium]